MANFESFKKELEKHLAEHECKLELWKNVKRLSKKDGTDFAHFGKNFENAKVTLPAYLDFERLKVNGRIVPTTAWTEDEIDLVRDADDSIPEERTFEHYGKKKYHLTVDEAFEAIENRIRFYEVEIQNDKLELAHAESIFNLTVNTIKALYDEALKEIVNAGFEPTCWIDTPSILYQVEKILQSEMPPHISTKEENLKVKWQR